MFFLLVVLAIWVLYAFITKRRKQDKFRIYPVFLPLVLFSIILTIDLGINYLSAYNIQAHDGISIDGVFAYLIIADDNWSIELFRGYYHKSMISSTLLLLVYSILKIVED